MNLQILCSNLAHLARDPCNYAPSIKENDSYLLLGVALDLSWVL